MVRQSHNKSADFQLCSTLLLEVFPDKQTGGMKRESTLTVQSEKPSAYAGRREREAPAVATTGNAVLQCRAI